MYNIKFKLPDLGVYKPLAVIGMILCIVSFRGADDIHGYMLNFMAGFFIIFATFKLFDLNAFQNAFSKYDIVAEKYPLYGYFYPFIELILGLAFLYRFLITVALFLVLVIMSIGCVGVIKALVKGEKLTCVCLGLTFDLPMSKITVFENVTMIIMSVFMLFFV